MFRSILCATDFSHRGNHAVDVAAKWAAAQSARLDVLHVVAPLITGAVAATDAVDRMHRAIQHDAQRTLNARCAALAPEVRATGHVRVGFARSEIAAQARALGSDLIVLATGGESAVARALLGSVVDRVLRTTPIPLLVVPETAAVALPSVIVAPTDLTPSSIDAVAVALDLGVELSATVEVVHTYEIPPLVGRDSPLVRDLSLTLREGVRSVHQLGSRANLHVVEGPAARSIAGVALTSHAELIVMAASGRSLMSSLLLGGVTDRIVRTSSVPVLVLRDAPAR